MRIICTLATLAVLAGCMSSLERQAGSAAKADCWRQAEAYVQANLASIANEWREHEKYKQYQKCLAKRINSTS